MAIIVRRTIAVSARSCANLAAGEATALESMAVSSFIARRPNAALLTLSTTALQTRSPSTTVGVPPAQIPLARQAAVTAATLHPYVRVVVATSA